MPWRELVAAREHAQMSLQRFGHGVIPRPSGMRENGIDEDRDVDSRRNAGKQSSGATMPDEDKRFVFARVAYRVNGCGNDVLIEGRGALQCRPEIGNNAAVALPYQERHELPPRAG